LDALAVAAAARLVDQYDAVLRPLVDGLARAGGEAGGVGAVVADPGEGEEPHAVLGELGGLAVRLLLPPAAGGGVLVNVGGPPLRVGGEVAQGVLGAVRSDVPRGGLEDGLAGEGAVGAVRPAGGGGVPVLAAG